MCDDDDLEKILNLEMCDETDLEKSDLGEFTEILKRLIVVGVFVFSQKIPQNDGDWHLPRVSGPHRRKTTPLGHQFFHSTSRLSTPNPQYR